MSSLFNIKNEYKMMIQEIINLDGEITPEMSDKLAINLEELQEKSASYCYVIRHEEKDIDLIDDEIKRLQDIKKRKNNAVALMKSKIQESMELYSMTKIESDFINISFRKSESIEIINEELIPDEYKVVQPSKVSKTLIKDAIKSGKDVPGASIDLKYNLQIK